MAFNAPSPSPGPGWTALPEPADSSGPSSEVDEAEREEIDFTPPNTQRRQQQQQQRSPTKKRKPQSKHGGGVFGDIFRPPDSTASASGSKASGATPASSGSSGAPSSTQASGSRSGGIGGSRSAVNAEANAERMRQLESVMSGGRASQSHVATTASEQQRRPTSSSSGPAQRGPLSSTQGRGVPDVSRNSLNAPTAVPNDSASAGGPSRPLNQTKSKGKPPTLLTRMSDSASRARTLAVAKNAVPFEDIALAPSASQASTSRPRPSHSPHSSVSARPPPQTQKTTSVDQDVIEISSDDDEPSRGTNNNKAATSKPPSTGRPQPMAGNSKQPQSNARSTSTSSGSGKEPSSSTKQKTPLKPPRPIQTARKTTGGVMPRKSQPIPQPRSDPGVSDSDDEFPTGFQLSQQVRREENALADKGKGKATPRQLIEKSLAKKSTASASAGPSRPPGSSNKSTKFAVPGRPASASVSSTQSSSKANPSSSVYGRLIFGKQPDAPNRRHTISADGVIDLSGDAEELRPTQNRRTSLQNTALRGGNKDDPLLLDDSGDESPPNEIPVAPTAVKKKKKKGPKPTLLKPMLGLLSPTFKPLERAQALSANKQTKPGNTQGSLEPIVLSSDSDDDVRPSVSKKDKGAESSSTPTVQRASSPSNSTAAAPGPSALDSSSAVQSEEAEPNFASMDDDMDMGVPFDDPFPDSDYADLPPPTPNDNENGSTVRDSATTSDQPTPTPSTPPPLSSTAEQTSDVPMLSKSPSPISVEHPEVSVVVTEQASVDLPQADEVSMLVDSSVKENVSINLESENPKAPKPISTASNPPQSILSDDFQSSVDGDAAEVDALLDSVVDSQRSTPFDALKQRPEHVEERRSVAPTLASELDNMSLQKGDGSSGASFLNAVPSERPSTPDESAIPLAGVPRTPKSPATPKGIPFAMKGVPPFKASPAKVLEVAPTASITSPALSSTTSAVSNPHEPRSTPLSFNLFKDAIRRKEPPIGQSSGAKEAAKSDSPLTSKSSLNLQVGSASTSSDTSAIPFPTPTSSLPKTKDKAIESTPSKISSSNTIFQESLSKLAPLDALVPAPQPRRDIKTIESKPLSVINDKTKVSSATDSTLGSKQAALLGQVIRKNVALKRGPPGVPNLDLIRNAHAESKLRQLSSQEARQEVAREERRHSSASQAEKRAATTSSASVAESKLSEGLQTLDIVGHNDERRQWRPIVHRAETTNLKRTRSMSTLDSDTTSSDHPFKRHSYDVKKQRAAKRPLTSTKMDEIQNRVRLASGMAFFRPPSQKTTSPLSSGRSSSSVSQSDDDRNIVPPSPTTSTEDPMDLFGSNDVAGGSNVARSSPISSVTSGLQQISVVSKDVAPATPAPNYGENFRLAKDIPRELHNEINTMDPEQRDRKWSVLRTVFEAQMWTNTVDDEPHAPRIQIVNDVDDDPTPPFEFYYTNLMWYGDGVPPPDYEGVEGCDCVGPCNPKSKTCACIKRQREQFKEYHGKDTEAWRPTGFMYDKDERLVQAGYPIIECNYKCRCSDDCINRVVQRGRRCVVNITKTKNKGWGVFAAQKIPKGTFVGIYSGELLTEEESEKRGLVYNKAGRTYLFDIDCWYIGDESVYTIDAYHAGNFTRFLNHSCDPACSISFVYINDAGLAKPLFALFTKKDVAKGEELTFSYCGDNIDEEEFEEAMKREEPMVRDKVYDDCMCGAKNCRGKLFR